MELEIRAVREFRMPDTPEGQVEVEVCYDDEADFFSVYVGKPGSFCCLGDFPELKDAVKCASGLAVDWDIPFFERVARRC